MAQKDNVNPWHVRCCHQQSWLNKADPDTENIDETTELGDNVIN